jgi:hypothetical protein
MKIKELKDMDIEKSVPNTQEDVHIDKVITVSDDEKPEKKSIKSGDETMVSEENTEEKSKMKVERKIKKSEKRLTLKYEELKKDMTDLMEKEKQFLDKLTKKEELLKDLKNVIDRSKDLDVTGKTIGLLKKVQKKMNRDINEKNVLKKIKDKVSKLEKKISRIETKLG